MRRPGRLLGLAALAVVAAGALAAEPRPGYEPRVAEGAREEVVYDWAAQRCETWDIPDAPLRAFRDAEGGIVAFASHHRNRALTGRSLDGDLRHGCTVAFSARGSTDPADYSDMSWITATWTDDGRAVAALLHDEYHADRHPGACSLRTGMACWYNAITAAASEDGGASFRTAEPPVVVAAAGFRQDVGQGRHRGFFNPSNIVEREGAHYVLIGTTGGMGQKPGICLYRTSNVFDPGAWRAWDGTGFTVAARDPYRSDAAPVPCRPVKNLPVVVGSLTRHVPSGRYLAIYDLGGEAAAPDGRVAYSWSDDLVDWTPPQTLMRHATMWSRSCSDTVRYAYASLLDPSTARRNFDEVGSEALLFLTRFHMEGCRMGARRDLVRLRVAIVPR